MNLLDIVRRDPTPEPWGEVSKIPWDDPDFSRRMLAEHLSQAHDAASRRTATIERHVAWIHDEILGGHPAQILDLGCGPGLYLTRLAQRGHTGTGIDFGPASIEHAQAAARKAGVACEFRLADIREAQFPAQQDLVMLIFGELNVFHPDEALDILTRSRQALRPGGTLLLEVHTFDAVRRMGAESPGWRAAERGLFSDQPHIRLDEAHWDAQARAAVNRHYVIDADTGSVTRYGASVQAYELREYERLLATAGFERHAWRGDWPDLDVDDFALLLGTTAP